MKTSSSAASGNDRKGKALLPENCHSLFYLAVPWKTSLEWLVFISELCSLTDFPPVVFAEKKMICVNSLMMKLPEVVVTVGANGKLTKIVKSCKMRYL